MSTPRPTFAIVIRHLFPTDSIEELTALIRRAYKRLADMGLNFTGSFQTPQMTLERNETGECCVALIEGKIVGTVLLHTKKQWSEGWYARPDVAVVGQFAVEPDFQNLGIGGLLMDHVESKVSALGLSEVSLDTAEPAEHLIRYYMKRGYRFIEYRQWEGKTYRSVVMSKRLICPKRDGLSAASMSPDQTLTYRFKRRSWTNIPHVLPFDFSRFTPASGNNGDEMHRSIYALL